jgi:glutamate carboxypeptidase
MGLSERESRVCHFIAGRASALLDDLRLHVGLPTGGRNIAALDETRERLVARAASLGAKAELIPGVPRPDWLYGEKFGQSPLPVAACRRGGVGGRELLIAGHLDTVHDPAGSFRSLTIATDGKTAIGPGCVDMKGGLVIALAALEVLEEVGERLNWTLLLNSDEETGSYHSAPTITAEAARVAAAGGLGIALEPATADGGLVVERAGSAQIMIEVRGRAAHVGRDFGTGVSAVLALATLINQVAALGSPSDGLIVNFGPLQGGAATNVVPDLARAWGNVRFSTPAQWRDFEGRLRLIASHLPSGASIHIEASVGRPAKPQNPDVLRFAELCRGAAESLGQKLPFSKTAGVCDGNLMQAAGLPTLDTLGVRGGGLHTPQEWIELSSLVERCQLLAVVMMRAAAITPRA